MSHEVLPRDQQEFIRIEFATFVNNYYKLLRVGADKGIVGASGPYGKSQRMYLADYDLFVMPYPLPSDYVTRAVWGRVL